MRGGRDGCALVSGQLEHPLFSMKNILVIDDDEYSGEVAAGHLVGAGYNVSVLRDGFAGLKWILTEKPDLVLTDIWMPIGTGLSLAQRLRELGRDDIPIIFMTADHRIRLRAGAKALGVSAFLEKPYAGQELLVTVAALLSAVQQRRSSRRQKEHGRSPGTRAANPLALCTSAPQSGEAQIQEGGQP
ncbi:MAG: hypothetical protein RLY20_3559 [Verrucomicrobiota bacterium]|jgi:two-component system chemotaxis response regulator CheY